MWTTNFIWANSQVIRASNPDWSVPWLWWLYGGLTWVWSDSFLPTCSWSFRRPEHPSHWVTDLVSPLIAMNCLRALIATGFAEGYRTTAAPDIDMTVSTNERTLTLSLSPWTLQREWSRCCLFARWQIVHPDLKGMCVNDWASFSASLTDSGTLRHWAWWASWKEMSSSDETLKCDSGLTSKSISAMIWFVSCESKSRRRYTLAPPILEVMLWGILNNKTWRIVTINSSYSRSSEELLFDHAAVSKPFHSEVDETATKASW